MALLGSVASREMRQAAACESHTGRLRFSSKGTATRLAPALAVSGEGSSGGTFPHPFQVPLLKDACGVADVFNRQEFRSPRA